MDYLRGNIKLIHLLLLPAFLLIGNQSLKNRHAHLLSNQIVVHSHPLEKNNEAPLSNHSHSKTEFLFYSLVDFNYFTHTGEQIIETGTFSKPFICTSVEEQPPYIVWLNNTDSRDPPALII